MGEGINFTPDDANSETTSSKKKKRGIGQAAAKSSEKVRDEPPAEKPRPSLFENPEPVSESKAPLEKLNVEEEKPKIVQALAGERGKAVAAEVTDGSPEAEAAKAAAAEFYAETEESGDPEAAFGTAQEVTGASAEEISEADQVAAEEVAIPQETEAELPPEGPAEFDEEGEIMLNRGAEIGREAAKPQAEREAEEDENDTAASGAAASGGAAAGAGGAAGAAAGAGAGGGRTGGGAPPHGPVPPFGPGGPGGYAGPPGGPGGPPHFGGGFTPNVASAPATNPNIAPRSPDYDVGNPAVTALIGGVIGYLIGRRRGRIKTEKKLLPIQKKLEKQVVDLDWQLQEKEAKIRRVAAEQVRMKGEAAAERIRQAAAERQAIRAQKQERAVIERRPAPEAHHLHGSQRQQEHIGHMLLAAEAPLLARQPKAAAEIAGAVNRVDKKQEVSPPVISIGNSRIETLNRAELLNLSEKIVVDGSSLRQIYESHLIGERGLRRLVGEHLRGGDLKKALRQEVVEREIDFERDPAMRDLASSTTTPAAASGGGKAVLESLLQKAEAGLPTGNEEAAFFKARADYQAAQHQQQQKQRRVIDISLTAVIVALVSTVVYIFLTRG